MGRLFVEEVSSGRRYCCRYCNNQLGSTDDLISKSFHSRAGKAYLFDKVYNVFVGKPESRLMTTGQHVVADINCTVCMSLCGWTYLAAQEKSQKYKEGKFILERAKLLDSAAVQSPMSQQSSASLENASNWNEEESEEEDPCT